MDTSRGGINGDAVNAYEVNGGGWTMDAAGTAAVGVAAALLLSMRHGLAAPVNIALPASAVATRRRNAVGTATMALSAQAIARRRVVAIGAADIGVDGTLTATRRRTLRSASTIALNAHADLFWRFRQQAPRERRCQVPLERQSPAITRRSR